MPSHDPEDIRRLFEAFYALPARDVMDPTFRAAAFLPPHMPVLDAVEVFQSVDHAWIVPDPARRFGVQSILLRRDLLRAMEPTHESYSKFLRLRFRSLAHGAADCTCCLVEGRVLHRVGPDTPCRDVVHLMESKGALWLPVIEGDELVGEIGSLQVIRALHRLRSGAGR
ncbi:CBS domain-containing protein [Deferrisoma camini]|uniref:CBS domain-containing protein n=1 Tax=Deferrisoma camini TaxID=1035120 RepID=UPI00046C8D39|nr:CBS domain-containing protein [Deferrisoma camini]